PARSRMPSSVSSATTWELRLTPSLRRISLGRVSVPRSLILMIFVMNSAFHIFSRHAMGIAGNAELFRRQFFHEYLGLAPALFVFLAPGRRQVLSGSFHESGFGLEVRERLRRERDQLRQTGFSRLG